MFVSQTTMLFALVATVRTITAQSGGVCGSGPCDDENTLCGVCDFSDPQICTVGGTQHVCMENIVGQGGGVSKKNMIHNMLRFTDLIMLRVVSPL
ncbi:hypothetical protein KCV07_g1918, partial [Aureobasidium melanogenum]